MIQSLAVEDRPRSSARECAALLALLLGNTALFAAYYPPLAGIEDEIGFLNQALVWSRGAISAEGAGLPADLAEQHDHYRLGTPKR